MLSRGETAWEPKFHNLSDVTRKRGIFILLYSVDAEGHINITIEMQLTCHCLEALVSL